MCGFVGKIDLKSNSIEKDELSRMLEPIVHRGPDYEGIFIDRNVGLGFRRLSILDLSINANQPMFSDDKDHVIVFNGEIYNYQSIRQDLEKKGFKFNTSSDTEVLLKSYIHYGIDCLNLFNGMFAFVIYNRRNKMLFMARDRAGKKPLHYLFNGNSFLFSSEIKSLLKERATSKEISSKGLLQYLTVGYTLAPDSIFKAIKKMKPGYFMSCSIDNLKPDIEQRKYWKISFKEDFSRHSNINEWADEFHLLFKSAIKIRLNADVPIGIFLSGGLDSTAIVSTIAKETREQLHAFTIGFDSNDHPEILSAKTLINQYPNVVHHVYVLRVDEALNHFEILNSLDEPFSDPSIIPTAWISKLVKDSGFKVALSGDGGDEIMAGYYKNQPFLLFDIWHNLVRKKNKQFSNKLLNLIKNYKNEWLQISEKLLLDAHEMYWFSKSIIKFHLFDEIFNKKFKDKFHDIMNYKHVFPISEDRYKKTINLYETNDFKYQLADGYLTKVDRASMFNSLEVRNPFLDYRIIDLLSKIPIKYKFNNNETKILIRKMLKGSVPEEILSQKKTGFSFPLRDWTNFKLKNSFIDVINSSFFKEYLRKDALEILFSKSSNASMHNRYSAVIYSLYNLSLFFCKWNIKPF
ncbi:asparagine synthase (glutamine-hydrolyzing) [Candidatus Parcubacteria bacterium]|nr:MAG: asparagine synthase (glutamine-hydrolyzing) [Candidatus Parcubacteria bacterium]